MTGPREDRQAERRARRAWCDILTDIEERTLVAWTSKRGDIGEDLEARRTGAWMAVS